MTQSAAAGLTKNLATMLLWQIGNSLIPLATFPYLARTLGPSEFGVLGVATAIAAYCTILAEWGFNLSGPRAVVGCRRCPEALNALIWSTMSAKACLCLLSAMVLAVAFMLNSSLASMKAVVFFSWLAVAGNVITLNWLFQGLESFSLFATVSLAGRFLTLPLTFVLVKSGSDTAAAAAIQAAAAILTGVLSLYIAWRMGLLRRPVSSWRLVYERLAQSAQTFISTASVSLFGATNAMILGYAGGTHQVGIYAAADKIKTVGNMVPAQLNTVLYPRIARLFADDRRAAARLTVAGAVATFALTAAGVVLCAFLARPLIALVLGPGYAASAAVLQLLCLATLFGNLAYFLGLQVLVPFGEERHRSMVMLCAGGLNVMLALALTPCFGAVGVAASFAIAEAVILAVYLWAIVRTVRMKAHFMQLVRG